MRKLKAIISFEKYKDLEVADIASHIILSMTNNASFPAPPVPLKTIQTALTAYNEALKKSYEGSKADTATKNLKRKDLQALLSTLGNYVNLVADGDVVMLDNSGYPISKIPETVGVLPPPAYLHVTDSDVKGQLHVAVSPVAKATVYVILYCEAPAPEDNSKWQAKLLTRSTGTISGLKSTTRYVFKAAACSTASSELNEYKFSDPVERVTQ
ncbi:MAG: hypothetical protein WCJ81_09485 [bacterium]